MDFRGTCQKTYKIHRDFKMFHTSSNNNVRIPGDSSEKSLKNSVHYIRNFGTQIKNSEVVVVVGSN